jgi:uncharacterized membrane protein
MNIKELLRYPEKIPSDKRLHFMIGTILTALIAILTVNLYIMLGLLVLVAYGIEYGQKWTKSGHFDHWDAIAVILGGLTVMVAMWRIVL